MKDNSGKVLLAMLAGASAGVIAGLLMAPDTGEVTRNSVKKWAGKMSKDLEKNLQDGLEEIKKTLRSAISKGLKLAIFNSCDGLGLARQLADLNLPYIIVWREVVPDKSAQKFLQYFILPSS